MSVFQPTNFLSSVQTDVETAKLVARKIFDAYDRDHSSAIENYEINPLLQDLYRAMNKSFNPTQSDVEGYSRVLDRNGDGRVTLQDIENLCIKYLVSESTLSRSSVVTVNITPGGGYLHESLGESVKKSAYPGSYTSGEYSAGLITSPTRTFETSLSGHYGGGEYAKKSALPHGDTTHLSYTSAPVSVTIGSEYQGSSIKLVRRSQLEEARRIFDRFDADHSGYIDQTELKALMEETYRLLGVNRIITSEDVASYIAMVDSNKDGKISPQEYETIVIKSLERIGIIFE